MPAQYHQYLESWSNKNPTWEVNVRGREWIEQVAANYPQYPAADYPLLIQQCDAYRPLLLHQCGGVYSDLDVEPHRPLDPLFARYPFAKVLLVVEIDLSRKQAVEVGRTQPIRNGVAELSRRMANYFMASVPGHPFWLAMLDLMQQRRHLPIRNEYDVLYTTGPDIVTEIAHLAAKQFPDVVVVPKRVIDKYITHHGSGSWRGF